MLTFHVHLVSKVLSGLFIQDVRIFFLSRNCGEQVFLPLRSYRTFKMIPKQKKPSCLRPEEHHEPAWLSTPPKLPREEAFTIKYFI